MRVITLPAINKQITIGQYVKAIKLAKQNKDKEFKHGLTCWWPCLGWDIIDQFRAGIQDRINQAVPYLNRH